MNKIVIQGTSSEVIHSIILDHLIMELKNNKDNKYFVWVTDSNTEFINSSEKLLKRSNDKISLLRNLKIVDGAHKMSLDVSLKYIEKQCRENDVLYYPFISDVYDKTYINLIENFCFKHHCDLIITEFIKPKI